MKNKSALAALLGLFALQGVASAEMISGTITSIDMAGNKVTLLRSDTRDSVTVKVKDPASLNTLQTGSTVSVDASKRLFGGWETRAIDNLSAPASTMANNQVAPTETAAPQPNEPSAEANLTNDASSQQVNANANPSSGDVGSPGSTRY